MYQQQVKIIDPNGLHIRPAAKFVKEAKNFNSDITVIFNGKIANAKSLFKIQTLGLTQGSVITITGKGKDEKKAVKHLINLINNIK